MKIVKVFVAIALAIIAGLLSGPDGGIAGFTFVQVYGLIGQLFLNALTLVVVPLVASSIIVGVSRMGAEKSVGTLGVKTFSYFFLTLGLASLVGLLVVNVLEPGIAQKGVASSTLSPLSNEAVTKIEGMAAQNTFDLIAQIILQIVPSNIFAVAAQGQMLGLICFSMLFGFFISRIAPQPASILLGFWQGVFQVMMEITHLVMKALPIGVFGLVAKVVATSGLASFSSLAFYFGTVIAALLIYMCVVLSLLLKFVGGVSPLAHFRAMVPALVTAFSTSSTAATLPVTIECVEKRAGVSNRVCSFTVPLGTSLNLTGTALYECVVVLFIAQSYGIELSLTTQFVVFLMAVLTSFGMAGIPSASLIAIVMILTMIGLPADGIGLVLAVERILDMSRTAVNVYGISCCSVLVASSEGEKQGLNNVQAAG